MRHPAVAVRGLVMRYGHTVAVDSLDLEVPVGVVAAVLGPNGAGKTTTLETCEGYRRPQAGTVRVLGLDPRADRRLLLPRIGVMLQEGGAWSGVRAVEMLRYAARLHAHPLDVDLLVERLGLGACARTPYRRLSGGQRQRLSLATALVGRPELVFVDEPTAGLDPQARHAVWDLVRDMRADGATVVLTTHFMDEAERLADLVFVLDHGRVVVSGPPAALTADGNQGVLRFHTRLPVDLDALRGALGGTVAVDQVRAGEYVVRGTTSDTVARLTAWCGTHGVPLEDLHVGRRTLEDVFLELTGRELRP